MRRRGAGWGGGKVLMVPDTHLFPVDAKWIYLEAVLLEFVAFTLHMDVSLLGVVATTRVQLLMFLL